MKILCKLALYSFVVSYYQIVCKKMMVTFSCRSRSALSHQPNERLVYRTVNSLKLIWGVIYTLEVGQTVFAIRAMLMLFILHSATTNSVWYTFPWERPQCSGLEMQYERVCRRLLRLVIVTHLPLASGFRFASSGCPPCWTGCSHSGCLPAHALSVWLIYIHTWLRKAC